MDWSVQLGDENVNDGDGDGVPQIETFNQEQVRGLDNRNYQTDSIAEEKSAFFGIASEVLRNSGPVSFNDPPESEESGQNYVAR